MERQPPSDLPVVRAALSRAIALKGSQKKLAAACGVTQAAISRATVRGSVSPQLALAIHRATGGLVPGSLLRPDFWRRAQDVPTEAPAASVEPGQRGDHGAVFRLSERSDGVLIEIFISVLPAPERSGAEQRS
jgi:DNA-binding transcriptional regulator YdaS (Cro superfamily)